MRIGMSLGVAVLLASTTAAAAQTGQPPAKPNCTVSDVRPSATPAAPSRLTPAVRREIFLDLRQAVARSQREAAAAYPTAENGALMAPTDVQKDMKLSKKRDNAALSLERVYVAGVLKERSLTCAAARDIVREGNDAGWASRK